MLRMRNRIDSTTAIALGVFLMAALIAGVAGAVETPGPAVTAQEIGALPDSWLWRPKVWSETATIWLEKDHIQKAKWRTFYAEKRLAEIGIMQERAVQKAADRADAGRELSAINQSEKRYRALVAEARGDLDDAEDAGSSNVTNRTAEVLKERARLKFKLEAHDVQIAHLTAMIQSADIPDEAKANMLRVLSRVNGTVSEVKIKVEIDSKRSREKIRILAEDGNGTVRRIESEARMEIKTEEAVKEAREEARKREAQRGW